MYNGHKIVCVTPAGRRRYMKLLVPYILSSNIVDEYQIWANTLDQDDLDFFRRLAAADARVIVIDPPQYEVDGNLSIGQFFRYCVDPAAVYIRFDDDIVFISEGFFPELIQFRISNPQYFIVSPMVINNALCSYVSQARRRRNSDYGYVRPYAMDHIAWYMPEFALHLHRLLLHSLATDSLRDLLFDRQELAVGRFSINCISWLGREFAKFAGVLPYPTDEEEWISALKPTELGQINCIYGRALVSHFAFQPQREYLDATDLLDRYEELCIRRVGSDVERLSAGLVKTRLAAAPSAGDTNYHRFERTLHNLISNGASWKFLRSDGVMICEQLRLLPNGEIRGYIHDNESRWEFVGGYLCFISTHGDISTRFHQLILDDGEFRIVGCYLFDAASWNHLLVLDPAEQLDESSTSGGFFDPPDARSAYNIHT